MELPGEIQKRIDGYLKAVELHLPASGARERNEILEELRSHIRDALAARAGASPTIRDVEAVLAEMDPPESYALESAGADAGGFPPGSAALQKPAGGLGNWALGLMVLGIVTAGCLIAVGLAFHDPAKGGIIFTAIALGVILELLAFAIGVGNWRQQAGKVAAILSALIVFCGAAFLLVVFVQGSPPRDRALDESPLCPAARETARALAGPSAAVAAKAEDVTPLGVGDAVPDVTLTTADGRLLGLRRAVAAKLTVIIFYRGGWCVYCNRQLDQLRQVEDKLMAMGYQVIAISPDRPQKAAETAAAKEARYMLLSDSDMAAAKAFGLAFRVDDATVKTYKDLYGIDLAAASGRTHHQLPVPGVFIAGTDGLIRFAHADANYKVRLSPDALLAAAREALEAH